MKNKQLSKSKLYLLGMIFLVGIGILGLMSVLGFQSFASVTHGGQYLPLVDGMKQKSKKAPLYPLNDFDASLNLQGQQETLKHFRKNVDLVKKIRRDLNGGSIQWELDKHEQRLLFVPEQRSTYDRAYKTYCQELVAYVLDQTNISNPYNDIISLRKPPSHFPEEGVTAYIVHNLAQEYVSTYKFTSNASDRSCSIQMRGKKFLGRVGSYSSQLVIQDDGSLRFERDTITIWQNNAKNLYTALMVPAEETLHIALRSRTEQAIANDIMNSSVQNMQMIEDITEHWLAVEEAIVGGLVRALVPPFLEQKVGSLRSRSIEDDLEAKKAFGKYKYLPKGIQLVEQLGVEKAIDTYQQYPDLIQDIFKGDKDIDRARLVAANV